MSAIQNRQPPGRPTGGRYAAASHGEAPAGLAHQDAYRLAPGESIDVPEVCDGQYVEAVNIQRSDDGTRHWVESAKTVDVADLVSRHLGGADPEEWLDRHEAIVSDYLNDRYQADTEVNDGWSQARVRCQGTIEAETVTAQVVGDAVWDGTKTIALHNESDPGTYGYEDLGRLLVEHVAAQRASEDTAGALRASRMVVPADRAAELLELTWLMRNQDFRVADAVAVAAAHSLAGDGRPALTRLSRYGYAPAKDLAGEVAAAKADEAAFGRASLVGAWLDRSGS